MFDIIKALLINKYQVNLDLIAEDSKVSELGLDSLGFVELLFDLEEKIGKKIPETLIKPEHVDLTLGELCTLLQTL
jgi:acyl carrier protein